MNCILFFNERVSNVQHGTKHQIEGSCTSIHKSVGVCQTIKTKHIEIVQTHSNRFSKENYTDVVLHVVEIVQIFVGYWYEKDIRYHLIDIVCIYGQCLAFAYTIPS